MTNKITQEELRKMVQESVRRQLKAKLLGEAVNVRAGTDIILAAEKEWHDFVYNVIAKQLGLASVETMPDDMGTKVLAVIKSEWPKIKAAVSSTAEKLSGFPKEGESNSVTNIQNPQMVMAEQGRFATAVVTSPRPDASWSEERLDAWAAARVRQKEEEKRREGMNPPEPRLPQGANGWELYSDMPGAEKAAQVLTKALEKAGQVLLKKLPSGYDPFYDEGTEKEKKIALIIHGVRKATMDPLLNKFAKLGASDSEPYAYAGQYLVNVAKKKYGIGKNTWTRLGDQLEESKNKGKFKVSRTQLQEMINMALKEKKKAS